MIKLPVCEKSKKCNMLLLSFQKEKEKWEIANFIVSIYSLRPCSSVKINKKTYHVLHNFIFVIFIL